MSERSEQIKPGPPDERRAKATPMGHHPSWTDSFPQTFHGWGPQTPDVEVDGESHVDFGAAGGDLHWQGRDDHEGHIVWRFVRSVH